MKQITTELLKSVFITLFVIILIGCKNDKKASEGTQKTDEIKVIGAFQKDVDFIKEYEKDLIVLQSGKSMVAIAPRLQGRVMTSSANGMAGASYGWINKSHYKSGEINPQINIYGGEERFWLGPEGGQYSIFFDKGEDFIFDNWKTPRFIDLESFEVINQTADKVSFTKTATIKNYKDFTFNLQINRDISIVSVEESLAALGIETFEGMLKLVGYRTTNTLKNVGKIAWTKDNGLLSIWMLGMFKHSETTTVVLPYVSGSDDALGAPVNIYESFGSLNEERLVTKENVVYFKADGKHRSKIGLSPQRAKDIAGSYDAENSTLTLVKYNKPVGVTDYVNSKWELQKHPFAGDVVNSYNDGSVNGGKPLGPFYELETSSPAAALQPQESITHTQYTFHFEGDKTTLNKITQATLGVSLENIEKALLGVLPR